MARTGRPRIEIDQDQFEKLCGIQCTLTELASFFKCSDDTIENWCKRTYKKTFSEVYKIYSVTGKISLRRTQFQMAQNNVSMAIWLGKQYLGQREMQAVTVMNDDESLKEIEAYLAEKKEEAKKDK